MNWLIWLAISGIGGVLGRLGGSASGNRLFRLLGVPACVLAMIGVFGHLVWSLPLVVALLLTFGAVLGASSTYFKAKNHPVLWWNFVLVGLVEGLALLPYVWYAHDWVGFGIRTGVCAFLVWLWDVAIGIDWLEEFGRYFIIVATIPLLFIHF